MLLYTKYISWLKKNSKGTKENKKLNHKNPSLGSVFQPPALLPGEGYVTDFISSFTEISYAYLNIYIPKCSSTNPASRHTSPRFVS